MAALISAAKPNKFQLFYSIAFLFLFSFYITTSSSRHQTPPSQPNTPLKASRSVHSKTGCVGLENYPDSESKCAFVRSEPRCQSDGYINYLQLFYCACAGSPVLGYAVLILWLVLLFYLLGNTAACYFCSSLERLSKLLNLSPTIAGVTLLSLGNGAPDVFASIVSFMGAGSGDVGLNSVLGGAFFISSGLVGIISILVSGHRISIDQPSFIRDVCFYLLVLSSLLAILIVGKINLWAAMSFTCLYFAYVLIVSTTHFCGRKGYGGGGGGGSAEHHFRTEKDEEAGIFLLDPVSANNHQNPAGFAQLGAPLLDSIGKEAQNADLGSNKTGYFDLNSSSCSTCFESFLFLVQLPLYLPRRLTIPVVCEDKWSKPFAVISVTLAPLLLAALLNTKWGDMGMKASLTIYLIGGMAGIVLGSAAFLTTDSCGPPKTFLLPWVAGGFLMSVTWTYIVAEELVALLVSLGYIFGINPSVLGLTVLAWGNSLGDLIANSVMAVKGGPDGAQIAISGCYAGPIFNTLVGLGLSMVFAAWRVYPSAYVVPKDPSLFHTLGFLVFGLLWAVVILPRKKMRLDKILGGGLVAIYLCFLSLRVVQSIGWVQLQGPVR
ncbi:hypothetical protein ACLOJK_005762 [Asimina triloba]